MEVSPTSVQREYVHCNTTERNANETSGPGINELVQYNWFLCMQILALVIASLGLGGNSLVLWLLGFRIQRKPFSVYILNLAGADFLFLACVFLICIGDFVGYLTNIVHLGIIFFSVLSYWAGLSLLAAISTERCLSLLFPISYRCHRPRHTSAMVCALIWALDGLIWVAIYFICYYPDSPGACPSLRIVPAVWFSLLIPVLCVSSLTLLLRVHCSSRRRQPPRLYGLILLTVLVFLLCGLPAGVSSLVPGFRLLYKTSWFPTILACVNSSSNPFLYFFLGSQRRRRGREPLRVILQRALGGSKN